MTNTLLSATKWQPLTLLFYAKYTQLFTASLFLMDTFPVSFQHWGDWNVVILLQEGPIQMTASVTDWQVNWGLCLCGWVHIGPSH